MRSGSVRVLLFSTSIMLLVVATSQVSAQPVAADLAADYLPGAVGQTSDDVGLAGTLAGSWHYHQENNYDTTDGTVGLLTFRNPYPGNPGTSAYAGSTTYVSLPVPCISDQRLMDGEVPGTPPPGSLMGHPGSSSNVTPLLAVEYRSDRLLENLTLEYYFDKPNTFGQATVHIRKSDGTVLLPTSNIGVAPGNTSISGTLLVGDLAAGESIWMMLGDGGSAAGDQTWMQMTLRSASVVPASSSTALIIGSLVLLAGLAYAVIRRLRQTNPA
jgi:hypothetical protein